MSSSHRRVDNRTSEEKAADKLKYHEDHHVDSQQFKVIVRQMSDRAKALQRLSKKLYSSGPNAKLSWQDARDVNISYVYDRAQLKADYDLFYKLMAELPDYFRLSRSRPGVKSSANTTPTAIGDVLKNLFFPTGVANYYGTVPAGVQIPQGVAADGTITMVPEGTDVMELLPLAKQGIVLRSTLLEVFYLYAWLRQLDDPRDGRMIRIDDAMAAAFTQQPALFTKVAVGAPKPRRKRDKDGNVVYDQKYERAQNVNNLSTIGAIQSYKPNYVTRHGMPFAAGQFMGSSDFQIISALNYYSSEESRQRVAALLEQMAAQGTPLTMDQLLEQLQREYDILRTIRRYYKEQRDNDPDRVALKKAKSEAAKANRKSKTKDGKPVVVDIGNNRSMLSFNQQVLLPAQ